MFLQDEKSETDEERKDEESRFSGAVHPGDMGPKMSGDQARVSYFPNSFQLGDVELPADMRPSAFFTEMMHVKKSHLL